jgi:glyoxylase I family protein
MSTPLKKLPMRLHHNAFTTEDHEMNRHFYEDVLGIPLTAMYLEHELIDGEFVELGHAFYELGDGSALAFFHFADPEKQASWKAREQSLFIHIALKVEKSTQEEIEQRLLAADYKSFILEHGYCTSLYVKDPNGLMLEFTADRQDSREIAAEMAATAHADMQRWIKGDRTPNNRWRPDMPATSID